MSILAEAINRDDVHLLLSIPPHLSMGLEGLVAKRRRWPYQAGRSKDWIKMKNRMQPAMSRVMEAFG